jgi:hypothetical protein
MLRRVGLRTLLPISSLALYLALMCIGNARESRQTLATAKATAVIADFPTRVKIMFALNVPAIATAFFLNEVVFHLQANYIFWLALPLVPLLWFKVGLWIDRRLGWVRRREPKRTFIRGAVLVVACLVAILFVIALLQTILGQRRSPGSTDMPWLNFGVCAWSASVKVSSRNRARRVDCTGKCERRARDSKRGDGAVGSAHETYSVEAEVIVIPLDCASGIDAKLCEDQRGCRKIKRGKGAVAGAQENLVEAARVKVASRDRPPWGYA